MIQFLTTLWNRVTNHDYHCGYRAGVTDYVNFGRKVVNESPFLTSIPKWSAGYERGYNDRRTADRVSKGYIRL